MILDFTKLYVPYVAPNEMKTLLETDLITIDKFRPLFSILSFNFIMLETHVRYNFYMKLNIIILQIYYACMHTYEKRVYKITTFFTLTTQDFDNNFNIYKIN